MIAQVSGRGVAGRHNFCLAVPTLTHQALLPARSFLAAPLLKHNRAIFQAQTATVEPGFENALHLLSMRDNLIQLAELLAGKRSPAIDRRCVGREAMQQRLHLGD